MAYEQLKSYADAMAESAAIFRNENPDFIVAPMIGSVPFIDAMAIMDDDFDASKVVYMPASSRIVNVNDVIRQWYHNFLTDVVSSPHKFPKVMGIDEVVSGSSVIRCLKNIDLASDHKRKDLRQSLVSRVHSRDPEQIVGALDEADTLTDHKHAFDIGSFRERSKAGFYRDNREAARQDSAKFVDMIRGALVDKLVYKTIGIEDSKKPERSREYTEAKAKGRITPVAVESIITMDKPDYCPPRFEPVEARSGRGHNLSFKPVVKDFVVHPAYVEFLGSLARYAGKDPARVAPINMTSILNSSKYLPAHLR